MIHSILSAFGFKSSASNAVPYGSGLINKTWLFYENNRPFILQWVNDRVFKEPLAIASNMDAIGRYLQQQFPGYFFVRPLRTLHGNSLHYVPGEGYYRVFPFVAGSHTVDTVQNSGEAYEAARQFGQFTRLLLHLPVPLKETLPRFHDLTLRYQQFNEALKQPRPERQRNAAPLIDELQSLSSIVAVYEQLIKDPSFRIRVTHHDTKISNVLFDEAGKGIAVIDLDTVMPGYFISDVGDMLRTYLSPVSEEESDFSRIQLREDYFEAIAKGYLSQMGDALSSAEQKSVVYAGKFMLYMQALRFLTDYLNNDVYYGARYEKQNLVRAGNQLTLLHQLIGQEPRLQQLVDDLQLALPSNFA